MSDTGVGWTEDRVERLKALWVEGWSASRIAGELGGVSRNAVIGKVHRLGLSGRTTTHSASVRTGKATATAKASASTAAAGRSVTARARSTRPPVTRGNLAVALDPAAGLQAEPEPDARIADVIPMARHLTLLELEACSCRWPIGDPRSPDFRFCGAPTEPGETYCKPCSRKAFQPRESRRR